MSRKEFLQFAGVSLLVLFGLNNFITMLKQFSKSDEHTKPQVAKEADHGFGSRKFGA